MEVAIDKAGRRIALRRMGVVEQLRLFKALGPELSLNHPYVDLAMIAGAVAMIDGVPIPFPVNEAGVEGVLERLGHDGVAAVDAALPAASAEQMAAEAGN
jgi:hypothetical protein